MRNGVVDSLGGIALCQLRPGKRACYFRSTVIAHSQTQKSSSGTSMKKASLLAAGFCVAAASSALQAQTVLRFNLWVPPTHHTHTKMMMPWANDVAAATNGRVKVEFTAASLGAPPRQFDLAAEGLADVTFGDHTYTPGRFIITKMVELPFGGDNAEALSVAFWRTYSPLPEGEKEHEGVKLLGLFTTGIQSVLTTKKKIDSLD